MISPIDAFTEIGLNEWATWEKERRKKGGEQTVSTIATTLEHQIIKGGMFDATYLGYCYNVPSIALLNWMVVTWSSR